VSLVKIAVDGEVVSWRPSWRIRSFLPSFARVMGSGFDAVGGRRELSLELRTGIWDWPCLFLAVCWRRKVLALGRMERLARGPLAHGAC